MAIQYDAHVGGGWGLGEARLIEWKMTDGNVEFIIFDLLDAALRRV